MKISWALLTFNRDKIVEECLHHNFYNAGYPIHEIVWVDNGSTDNTREIVETYGPSVSILHSNNLGVAKGYNRTHLLATGDYVVITGCDMKMPTDWLKTFVEYFTAIPETGIASMYSVPVEAVPERYKGPPELFTTPHPLAPTQAEKNKIYPETINGLNVIRAMPIERRMLKRELFLEIGFLREDLGLYGHDDCEWAERAMKVCKAKGLLTYAIPGQIAEHLGCEGILDYNGKDDKHYWEMKRAESRAEWKQAVLKKARNEGYPRAQPYCNCGKV